MRSNGFVYNIDSFVCDPNHELEIAERSEAVPGERIKDKGESVLEGFRDIRI